MMRRPAEAVITPLFKNLRFTRSPQKRGRKYNWEEYEVGKIKTFHVHMAEANRLRCSIYNYTSQRPGVRFVTHWSAPGKLVVERIS